MGEPVILETNTIPGMTPASLLPDSARHGGIEFPELCAKFMSLAVPVYGEAKALRLQNWVASLEQCSDVAQALDACLKEE